MRTIVFGAALAVVLSACSARQAIPAPPAAVPAAMRAAALDLTPFNAPTSVFPGATTTEPTGIREAYVTATVTLSGGATVGGLHDRNAQTWSQLVVPNSASTAAYGPWSDKSGYRVVGSYKNPGQVGDSAFTYDSWTKKYYRFSAPAKLCKPQACNYTIAHSTFGKNTYYIVGNYDAVAHKAPNEEYPASGHAFIVGQPNMGFQTIDVPGALSTTAYGVLVNGKNVIVGGGYTDKTGRHAYVRNLNSNKLLTYDYPKAALTHFEGIADAGGLGNYNAVGDFTKPKDKAVYGFFLQIRNWQPGAVVVIGKLTANSVNDRDVIGVYNPGSGISGFITSVPVIDPPR